MPVYHTILLCSCAKISAWWLLAVLVPGLNLAVIVYLYGSLAKRLGKNFWLYGIGGLVLGVNLFVMAFDSSQPVEAASGQDQYLQE
ncbi:MAG: DUF5684 domain-containing protein, partial [Negativicutes bacterium]|nr:DUF5684 domain-containing protein [Negativicutes bacterium]